MIRLLLICLSLAGCATTEKGVLLRWNPDLVEEVVYNTLIHEPSPEQALGVHGFDIIDNPVLREQVKHQLAAIKIPYTAVETTLKKRGEHLRVLAINVDPKPATAFADGKVGVKPIKRWFRTGAIRLQADIDTKGALESFFYQRDLRNNYSFLFRLPDNPVKVGDHWQIPLHIIGMNSILPPHETYHINQVSLESMSRDEAGNLVATLFYVAAEHVDSPYYNPPLYDTHPIIRRGSFIGLGEFYVEKGYWKRFTGQRVMDVTMAGKKIPVPGLLLVLEEMKP